MTVQGHATDQFSAVRQALAAELESGNEVGAAIAVDLNGELAVDVWGGYRNVARTLPWEHDTIVNVWSNTKLLTALAVLMCVDHGLIDLEAPVARYWPEFAAAGKETVTVAQIMSHTSGVAGWDRPFSLEDMYDSAISAERLAAQAPWWEPGTKVGYHAKNQGHLLGEIIRRVSGKTLKQFVASDIAEPLGVDIQIGALDADTHRIADVIAPPAPSGGVKPDRDSVRYKVFSTPPMPAESANTSAWRRADMGALNGHTNARALAQTLSVITLGGEARGIRLLSEQVVAEAFTERSRGFDLALGLPVRFAAGFALPEPMAVPYIPNERACYWGGWGGSLTLMFPERGLTISYVMNKMGPGLVGSERAERYVNAILSAT